MIIRVYIYLNGFKCTIIGIYTVNEDALVSDKEVFFNKLNETIKKIGRSREVIILGDFNSRTGKTAQ